MNVKNIISHAKALAEQRSMNRKGNTRTPLLFVAALVEIIIGLALLPTVRTFINASLGGDSTDGLIRLISTFWVIAVMAIAAGVIYLAFKNK